MRYAFDVVGRPWVVYVTLPLKQQPTEIVDGTVGCRPDLVSQPELATKRTVAGSEWHGNPIGSLPASIAE